MCFSYLKKRAEFFMTSRQWTAMLMTNSNKSWPKSGVFTVTKAMVVFNRKQIPQNTMQKWHILPLRCDLHLYITVKQDFKYRQL